MGAWKNVFFLQEKPTSVKFLLLGGGFLGGECRFYFYGREDFLTIKLMRISGVFLLFSAIAVF